MSRLYSLAQWLALGAIAGVAFNLSQRALDFAIDALCHHSRYLAWLAQ